MELLSRLLAVRQYAGNGQRAPHKPLLILLALSQFQRTGSSQLAWPVVEHDLGALLDEFGTPAAKQVPSYPFTRLRADGIWMLSADVPDDNIGPLRDNLVTGQFTPDVEDELRAHPADIPALARAVVDAQFPPTLADDVLLAAGFDPDDGRVVKAAPSTPTRKRSATWRENILRAWDRSCAFCGFDGALGGSAVGIEAAHIRWFNFDGPDAPDNGLALCSLHHKLFDRGALGLRDDTIVVSSHFTTNTDAGRRVYELHGAHLRPRPGTLLPSPSHVEWHTSQVFKGYSLTA